MNPLKNLLRFEFKQNNIEMNMILDEMAPIRSYQARTKYALWLSTNTKDLINKRDLTQKKAACSRDPDDWRHYK